MNPTDRRWRGIRLLDGLFAIACLGLLALVVHAAVRANADLTTGRFALFMDERITFDGVKKILHPEGLRQFFSAVLDGGDQRYGRSLWNSMALVSVVPERLFGDAGQIIASRLLQVALLIASYGVIAFGLLRSWLLRIVLLFAMMAMPFSDYFMTMPKPEPLQLFFLALFCWFFVKTHAGFSWYWIFAGLAFGTKISTLPTLLVFASIAGLNGYRRGELSEKPLVQAVLMFCTGLAVAVPILLVPLLLLAGAYHLFKWTSSRFRLGVVSRRSLALFLVLVVYFGARKSVRVWVRNTFLGTTHGADQASINAQSWIGYFFDTWLVAPVSIGVLLLVVIGAYLALNAALMLRSGRIDVDRRVTAWAIAVAGLALNVAIILGTKRLWGIYLYPGMVLLVIGTLLLVDANSFDGSAGRSAAGSKANKWLGHLVLAVLVLVSGLYWTPRMLAGLNEMSLRTQSKDYAQQYSSYQAFTGFLDRHASDSGKRLNVMLSPWLFPPANTDKYEIVEFWGPYVAWDKQPDVILFSTMNTPRGEPTPADSPNYASYLIQRDGYAAHVSAKGAACKTSPCFVRERELPNGGEILVLSKAK